MKRLRGRAAVITGAGSGFGLELARLAAAEGMPLVLADIDGDALERACSAVDNREITLLPLRTDVADAASMAALADATMARFGAPGLVFNNAGVGTGGLLWESSLQDWERLIGVNLMGVAHGVRLFTPHMLAAARDDADYEGHIVNTASMAGLQSAATLGIYNATKQAVVGLTETLFHDLRLVTDQVSASVLCPALVATGMHRRPPPVSAIPMTRSQQLSRSMVEQGMAASRVSAGDVARLVIDAVRNDRFYVFSHPEALHSAEQRIDDLMQGRPPPDPLADVPGLKAGLRAALRRPE